uniref:Uncharacterized protein n=1 Tax=Rhizophora mucronata TaxID=61149 RepID=A0A2P2PTL0_RHIMU
MLALKVFNSCFSTWIWLNYQFEELLLFSLLFSISIFYHGVSTCL